MKCPKCYHVNPDGTLFCEECDWRMDQKVKMERTIPPIYISMIAAVLGIAAVIVWYLDVNYGAIAFGAIGMVLGGYSMTFARITEQKDKMPIIILTGIGICTSVIGFLMGMAGLV